LISIDFTRAANQNHAIKSSENINMRIGILQTGDAPEELQQQHGNYSNMFVRLLGQNHADFEFEVYRVLDGQVPDDVNLNDGWLITGSRFSAYGKQPWIPALKDFIREIVDAGLPLVGICFGHQIIAEALGGRVEKSDKGWGLGLDTYTLAPGSPIDGQEQITLNIFHQDQIVKLPPGAEIYASSDFCQYAGMVIGDQVLTIQAHPEFQTEFNRQLLEVRKTSVIPEALAHTAIEALDEQDAQQDSSRFGASISEFFKAHQIAS
jgi:GMP synthase-like glutamine amidotransferase